MVSTSPSASPVAAEPARPVASYRTDLVTAMLGAWFTVGLFLDAWAHNNVPNLETFFTPWHAVFYSGFVATAGWIAWQVRRGLLTGRRGVRAVPVGYGPAVVAVVGFGLAGIGDMIWHTSFGVEQNINILFSPTHIGLISTMLVIVTSPLQAAWANRSLPAAPGLRRLLPAVLSIALATTLVLLFVQYANALVYSDVDVVLAMSTFDEGLTADFASSTALTTVVLMAPLLTLARRWVLPFGSATILYAAAAGLSAAVTGLRSVEMMLAVVAAGACVDLLGWWLRPNGERPARLRLFAALAPLVTWTLYIVTAYAVAPPLHPPLGDGSTSTPHSVVELYTGVPIMQAAIGLLLAVLLLPSRTEGRAQ